MRDRTGQDRVGHFRVTARDNGYDGGWTSALPAFTQNPVC